MKWIRDLRTQRGRVAGGNLLCLVLGLLVIFAGNFADAQRLCFPQYSGVPFTYSPPAVNANFVTQFNGNIDRDTGWTGAFRYVLGNGTPDPDGAVQANQDKSNHLIYLSFQIKNDQTFDGEDSIVIAFNPDNTGPNTAGPNMQRIIIHPVVGGVGATDAQGKLQAGSIEYAKGYDPNNGGWPNTQTDPAGITAVARSAGASAPLSWDVEVQIDSANLLHLPNSDFGMYVNLVRVDSSGPTDTQFTWPPNNFLVVNINAGNEILLEGDSLPPTNTWGTANLNSSCSGVSVVSITNNFPGKISTNNPNQFSATLQNTGTTDATGVKATFQIANYGLPAPDDWVRPGEVFNNLIAGDPVTGITVPKSGGTTTVKVPPSLPPGWSISTNAAVDGSTNLNERDYYLAHPDTCIRVALDSTVAGTVISQQSTWENFSVGTTSQFDHDAIISNRYKLAEGQDGQFELQVTRKLMPACTDPAVLKDHPELGLSSLNYVVHGCRLTGQFLVIKKRKFQNCESVGAYGFGLTHRGAVKDFTDLLTGEGLAQKKEKATANTYHLTIPRNKRQAVLHTRVVSVPPAPPGRCGQPKTRAAGAFLFLGLFVVGFVSYGSRRTKV